MSVYSKMECWVEDCWDDLCPELHGDEISKFEMIETAIRINSETRDLLIATLTASDKDMASQELKEDVCHFWTLHLQDYEDYFEAQIKADAKEARTGLLIDAWEAA